MEFFPRKSTEKRVNKNGVRELELREYTKVILGISGSLVWNFNNKIKRGVKGNKVNTTLLKYSFHTVTSRAKFITYSTNIKIHNSIIF